MPIENNPPQRLPADRIAAFESKLGTQPTKPPQQNQVASAAKTHKASAGQVVPSNEVSEKVEVKDGSTVSRSHVDTETHNKTKKSLVSGALKKMKHMLTNNDSKDIHVTSKGKILTKEADATTSVATVSKSSTSEADRVLETEFKDGSGKTVAKERCKRGNTAKMLKGEIRSKIKFYEEKIKKLEAQQAGASEDAAAETGKKIQGLRKDLVKLKAQEQKYHNLKREWSTTNVHKEQVYHSGEREELPPMLTNLNNQTLWGQEETYWRNAAGDEDMTTQQTLMSSINRSGAVSDFAYGQISLQELKDYKDLQRLQQKDPNLPPKRALELIKLYNLEDKSHNISYSKLDEKIKKLEKNACDAYAKEFPELKNSDGALNLEILGKICATRSARLTSMVLQDLSMHFATRPAEGDVISYTRIGLVNTNKSDDHRKDRILEQFRGERKNKEEFVHSESTQALDMKAIYDELNNRTIIFGDYDAPFIDDENNIRMPMSCRKEEEGAQLPEQEYRATLKSNFFNISTQLNTSNVGAQQAINDAAMKKMRANGLHAEAITVHENLGKIESSNDAYNTVADLVIMLQEKGHYISEDCYGGKDRTGYSLALTTFKKLLSNPDYTPTDEEKEAWRKQIIAEDGIFRTIIEENTGVPDAKLMALGLDLFTSKEMGGLLLKGAAAKVGFGKRGPTVKPRT